MLEVGVTSAETSEVGKVPYKVTRKTKIIIGIIT